jgi:hypothetical protein
MPSTIDLHAGATRSHSWFTSFTPWVPWPARLTLACPWPDDPLHSYGGVYLLAHLPAAVRERAADYLEPGIVYVGEGKHLKSRWKQFDRAARGSDGHSGGRSYFTKFGPPRAELHVAALGVWFSDDETARNPDQKWTTFYRLHVEHHILWALLLARNDDGVSLLNKR